MIILDFETRSKVDLKKAGMTRYAEDPSTDVLCMGWTVGIEEELFLWTPESDNGITFPVFSCPGVIFVAHNVAFDRSIYEHIMVKRYGFPPIPLENWRCSSAKAAAHAIPRSLADACGAMALPMQKDKDGRAVMLKLCKPNKKGEWNKDQADLDKLYAYCLQDIRAQVGLYQRLPDLIPQEQELWVLDQKINARGITVDMETVESAIKLIDAYNAELTQELNELTDDVVGSADERGKMTAWLALNGLEMETLTKGAVVDALSKELNPKVRRVLEIRQQLAKTSTAKYRAIKESVCADGRLRDTLMYHGASTGRWAGKGPQPQNLPRNTKIHGIDTAIKLVRRENLDEFRFCYEDPMEALSMMLRAMFTASEGKILVGGDYASVEVRVLFWLAGETVGLEKLRKGEDLYADLARKIYQVKEVTPAQRQLGKGGILGAGYGMGGPKFVITCKTQYGLDITEPFSKTVIDTYRTVYRSVVEFWYAQENAAIEAVKKGTVVTACKIKWRVANGFLYARLPSGRCLAYCHPKIENVLTPWGAKKEALTFMSVNPVSKKWERGSTYGGAIAENLTQAVARDLMADAMLRVERNGYDVLLTIHDELITEISEDHPDSKFEFHNFGCLMSDSPKWADGLPIKVETWKGKRYAK